MQIITLEYKVGNKIVNQEVVEDNYMRFCSWIMGRLAQKLRYEVKNIPLQVVELPALIMSSTCITLCQFDLAK